MTHTLLLSMLLPAAVAQDEDPVDTVDMSGLWLRALLPPVDPKPEKGPRPWVSARDVVLTEAEDAVRLRAEWTIHAVEPGWVDVAVVDASVRLDAATLGGAGVPLKSLNDGQRHLVAWIDRPTRLVVEGEIVGELRRGVPVQLLQAPVGRLRVQSRDPVVQVSAGTGEVVELDGTFWTGANTMTVSSAPEEPAARTDQLSVAAVGMGVTVSDGAMDVRARVRWRVVRGSLDRVELDIPGAGADLVLNGPVVARWTRSGDTIAVELREPQKAAVELEARWSTTLPDKDEVSVPFPVVEPRGVFRTERAVQIARDGDREIVPDFGSWEPIPTAALPEVARDLVVGTPNSAWRITDASRPALGLLRFSPVSGPSTLVDVAAYDGALSRDGRLLMRAHYTVRNDRGAFLRITPPPGTRIVGARVGGEPTAVARDGDTWLVPLLKSVETVQGLLNFPVDLLILSDGDPFLKKDERRLPLPILDAEVAVTRVTLSLPVGWDNRLDDGEGGSVEDFTEGSGITYGFASGDANVAKADALFQEALSAWMDNDFDSAQQALEDLRSIGADNENIARLQSNVDLVLGDSNADSGTGQAVALQRRVKEQAQARAGRDVEEQQNLLDEAEQAYLSGDYDKAESAYSQALEIGENLEKISQSESVEQSYSNVQVREKLEKAKDEKKKKKAPVSSRRPSGPEDDGEIASGFITIELSDEEEGLDYPSEPDSEVGRIDAQLEQLGKLMRRGADGSGSEMLDRVQALMSEKDRILAEQRQRADAEARARAEAEAVAMARAEAEANARAGAEAAAMKAEAEARRNVEEVERRAAEARAAEEDRRLAEEERYRQTNGAPPSSVEGGEVYKRSGGIRVPSIGGAKKSAPAEPPPPPPSPPPMQIDMDMDGEPVIEFGRDVPAGRAFESEITVAKPDATGRYEERTVIDFDGVDVSGELVKPEGALLFEAETFEPLDVTASSLDVVIPTYGQTVRYQHLLLPAGQAYSVVVRAKKNRRDP